MRLSGAGHFSFKAGFTLIEVLMVMSIFAILAGFTTINLLGPQRSANLNATVTELTADIKQQQARSMLGDTSTGSVAVVHGVYFEAARYTLFVGSTYSAADPANFVVDLPSSISLTTTLVPSQIVFDLVSGEVVNFSSGASTVTLSVTGGETRTLNFNKYGSVSIN